MEFSLIDIVGIALYLIIAGFIYKKAWFFSFYSFFKFILVFVLSLGAALFISSHNPYILPLTRLEQSLVIQGILFIILWKLISFKKIFFMATDKTIGLNRFIFMHHIDRFLNIVPSLVVSFFITFFLFTIAVSLSTYSIPLANAVQNSKIVRPASYQIYFATANPRGLGLFEGVAYRLIPVFNPAQQTNNKQPDSAAINTFQNNVNAQRQIEGLDPLHGETTFTPPAPTTAPQPTTPPPSNPQIPNQPQPTLNVVIPTVFPTSTPVPTIFIQTPTSIPVQNVPQPTSPPPQPQVSIYQVEQDIFKLTNEQRVQNGLPPFVWSNPIAAVARAYSQDMSIRHFFSHVNPEGLDPFQRLQIGGVNFSTAGENIAGGGNADIIVTNWMKSPAHRANILNPAFGTLGVGVAQDPTYGFLATQDFTN